MSARSAGRGSDAARAIKLALRASSMVATSSASLSRWVFRWPGNRCRKSAEIPAANSAIPPLIQKPLQSADSLNHMQIQRVNAASGKLTGAEVLCPKYFIHHGPHTVDILVSDLHKDRPTFGQQIAHRSQAVAEVGQVTVDAVFPGVTKRLHLLGFATDVGLLAV